MRINGILTAFQVPHFFASCSERSEQDIIYNYIGLLPITPRRHKFVDGSDPKWCQTWGSRLLKYYGVGCYGVRHLHFRSRFYRYPLMEERICARR